jgi:hypothetical protein
MRRQLGKSFKDANKEDTRLLLKWMDDKNYKASTHEKLRRILRELSISTSGSSSDIMKIRWIIVLNIEANWATLSLQPKEKVNWKYLADKCELIFCCYLRHIQHVNENYGINALTCLMKSKQFSSNACIVDTDRQLRFGTF